MHVVRREGWWAFIQAAMLLLCVVVEGTTAAYLYYRLDPEAVPSTAQAFMAGVPAVLFWVRALMGPICFVYVRAGVLPLSTERADVNRAAAAKAGVYVLLLVDEIMKIEHAGEQRFVELIDRLSAYLSIFRAATPSGERYEAEDAKLVGALNGLHAQGVARADIATAVTHAAGSVRAAAEADQHENAPDTDTDTDTRHWRQGATGLQGRGAWGSEVDVVAATGTDHGRPSAGAFSLPAQQVSAQGTAGRGPSAGGRGAVGDVLEFPVTGALATRPQPAIDAAGDADPDRPAVRPRVSGTLQAVPQDVSLPAADRLRAQAPRRGESSEQRSRSTAGRVRRARTEPGEARSLSDMAQEDC